MLLSVAGLFASGGSERRTSEIMNLDRLYHLIRSVAGLIGVAIVCSLDLSGNRANAQEIMKTCAGASVQSISLSAEPEREILLDSTPEKPTIKIIPAPQPTMPGGSAGKAVTIIALGPVLGAMDSSKVETDLACTAKGFVLTATITRNADYDGSVLANIIWRPKIEIAIFPRRPEVIVETKWRMRLTTGAELGHARTPPYPEQKFPISVVAIVR